MLPVLQRRVPHVPVGRPQVHVPVAPPAETLNCDSCRSFAARREDETSCASSGPSDSRLRCEHLRFPARRGVVQGLMSPSGSRPSASPARGGRSSIARAGCPLQPDKRKHPSDATGHLSIPTRDYSASSPLWRRLKARRSITAVIKRICSRLWRRSITALMEKKHTCLPSLSVLVHCLNVCLCVCLALV